MDSSTASTNALAVASAEDADIPAIVALWERCELTRPWNEPHGDLGRARKKIQMCWSAAMETPSSQP
jgi:hypothetical protein